ncbi:Uncharacterised protein [Klebsiella pneumoniae]|nr:Uncharacterised protein [Klebsiella pneumoniae]
MVLTKPLGGDNFRSSSSKGINYSLMGMFI